MATPSAPLPPAYTSEEVIAPTVATPTVLPEAAAPSHLSPTTSAPPPPPPHAPDDMAIDPPDAGADIPMSSEAAGSATGMDVDSADPTGPLPLGGIKIQALRPTVHPPQPRPNSTRIERPNFTRPALFQLFAEAFRPLPTLFSRFGDLTTKWGKRYSGWEIFTWLFPSMASKAPDPLPNPADATSATPDTPFQALVDRFVDLDSTFADARKMSQPQIVPESVDHLTFLPAPSPSPFKLPALLGFLSARIAPTLADLRAQELSPPPFLTLIVGSPAQERPSIPTWWAALPTMKLGITLHFSSLSAVINAYPFHWNGRLSSRLWPLFACIPPSHSWSARRIIPSVHSLPWMILLLVFLALLPSTPSPLTQAWFARMSFFAFLLRLTGQPVESRPDFVSHTPAAAMTALLAARSTTYQHCPSSRESVDTGSLKADLHFALYCTPYYGYVPENETDFLAMTFALADFLVYTCFTTNGEPNAALSNLSVRPGDLLTILSTIHPSFLSVSPGDGLFILPLTTSKAALRPFPVAWLYAVTEEDCPPPPFFVTLGAALGPGIDLYVSGIFQQAWALGPHARVYLNSSQLPLPYFRRTDELQVHTNNRAHGVDFGGYGAKQYHFVFSPDTHDKVSFANLPVTPEALPESFLSHLLALENWPSAATLLATPNNTISWPDNSSLRMWLPDVDSNFSPHHGITICCGRAGDRAQSHGPTLGYRDIHQESADRQETVWNSYFSHVPQYESLASVFYSTMEYWVGYTADAIPRSTIDPILASYKELCSHYQAGLHAWRLPPHTLAYNLYTHIFSMYALDSLLLEGFGAGAYSAAVAARLAYRPPPRAEYSKFDCVLTCLGGIAMPPKIFQELLDVYYTAHSLQLELANDSAAKGHVYDESSFTHSLRIVQHVHDRISPWSLSEILLNYLYNHGVAVLTLHDGVDEQRAYAELHNQIPFHHFGDYRHNYEKVVPTLKYFSAATFFASFLAPLTYEQLEARKGTLGATYCPDLLDLLLGLFSYMGIVPPLHFGAAVDALTPVLLRGCHREPNGDIIPMLHTTMEIHESPEAFYSRTFLQLLRIPALKNLGFSQEDVHALEDCLRQALMNLPLPQANLDRVVEKERQNNAHDLRDLCGTRIADLIRVFKDNPAFKCYLSNVKGEGEVSTVCWIIISGREGKLDEITGMGCHYTLEAIVSILDKGMRPGTKKTDGDIETTYDWPLNWEIPDFTSDLCKGLSTRHPEIFQLLTSLGRRFIAKFLIALLAEDGHFITLLLSTLWGLRGGFTTLCLQGIFGSGKTYCASMMLVVRRNQESSKLLILTPHNDTVDDLLDAVGLPPDNLPPSLHEFYLVMIYKQQLLPTTLAEFTRTDHKGKPYTPLQENVTFHEIHAKICNDSTLHQELERRATIETIVQIALDFPKGFSSYCTISNTVKAIGIGGVASVFVSCKISDFLTKTKEAQARNLVALTAVRAYASSSFPALTVLLLLLCIPSVLFAPSVMACLALAQEFLQGLISTADTGYKTVLRRRPVPLTDGPPDEDYIADGRLAAHLRETPAPHIMEEDAEPNEDLTGDDFTYSHDTTIAFQELLSNIDSNTKELPNVLSTKHYAALTQLPLTYPWARLVLDLKELLISFDRHLITCLIANQAQGNATPHPGNVLSSFLHHLAQEILLIIAPPGTDDAPPFLHHPEIYGTEFWHAHLNYACTRFAISHGSDRLLGNQICHWTTGSAETCMKVTHLVVFLPPALGAYVLSQHRTKVSSSLSSADDVSMLDEPHTLRINQSSLLTPPAVIKHQAEQIANARRRAAEGSLAPYTIPLLANTQTRSSKNRVTWTLKFTLPTPAEAGTTRRFSAVPRGYGPSGAHALEGAVRYAYPFDYQHEATTLLPNSDFLSLPDHVTQYGPVRAQTLGLHIPESIKAWLLSGAPRIYDRRDLELPGNRQIALPSILMRYFCSELTIQQFEDLLRGKQAENDKALDVAATECRMKRPKQTLARLPHPAASSTSTSAPLAPAPLGNTPPRIPDTERSRTPPPDRPRPIGMPPGPPVPAPPATTAAAPAPPPPPRTVYAGFDRGPVTSNPTPDTMGKGKGPAKGSKGDDSTRDQDTPFFTVAPQKGQDFAPKGGKKGKNKGKDKGGHKGKGKGKGKDQKG
eukprot:symbB.v1.2.039612.t1/scaffold6681.1/size16222/1